MKLDVNTIIKLNYEMQAKGLALKSISMPFYELKLFKENLTTEFSHFITDASIPMSINDDVECIVHGIEIKENIASEQIIFTCKR